MRFEEKPIAPKSDLIPIGVYFLRPDAFGVIDKLAPSGRGEFEITDVLNHYIPGGRLFTRIYDGHWTDAGTVASLLRAAELAATTTRPAGWRRRSSGRRHDRAIVTGTPARIAACSSPAVPASSARATSATSWPAAMGRRSRSSTS